MLFIKSVVIFSHTCLALAHCFRDRIISMKFMRKYVNVAKDMKPVLTRAAADFIADEYSKLRNQDNLQQESIARVSYFPAI